LKDDLQLIPEEALPLSQMAITAYESGDKSKYADVSSRLRSIAASTITKRALSAASDNPAKYVEYIKQYQYTASFSDKVQVQYLDDPDALTIKNEYMDTTKVLKSAYDIINESSHLGGWPTGQIIMVTSPPGGGKTLYMMSEASKFARDGHKVVYVALADMNISDFYIRLYALENQIPFTQATVEFDKAHQYVSKLGKNLAIIIAEADYLSVNDVVDYISTNLPDTEAVFLDYDSQFLIDKDDSAGSMYEYAVRPYISATRLKSMGITTFIGSQPRTSYYGQEYLDLNSAGESSKKQQMVDFILSIGTNDETKIPCGYIALPKARRFFNKFKVLYVRTIDGKIHTRVPHAVYAELRPKLDDPGLTSEKLDMIIKSGSNSTIVNSMIPDLGVVQLDSPLINSSNNSPLIDLGVLSPPNG
jgi:hypothetical protein